ncbi:hypothetical protein ACFPN6_20560 [Streptomyces fimbriatus]|uniref:Uncharacterized protein n=2 Tax=Streptomyces TaxID=1883 RepID=A0ABW0DCI8_STRFI
MLPAPVPGAAAGKARGGLVTGMRDVRRRTGTRTVRNEGAGPFARAEGWMPNGTWEIRSRTRAHDGDIIKGYAVHLRDMRCSKGTVTRTEMFLPSETNRDGGQGRTERRRWDGARH